MTIPSRRRPATKKPNVIGPIDAPKPDEVAGLATFLGSPEHKDYVNPINGEAPHQRSDGFRCEECPSARWSELTELLRAAIRAGCTSAAFDPAPGGSVNAWPRYVWGYLEGRVFEARHRTDPPGCFYKAYLLDEGQEPADPEARLVELRRHSA